MERVGRRIEMEMYRETGIRSHSRSDCYVDALERKLRRVEEEKALLMQGWLERSMEYQNAEDAEKRIAWLEKQMLYRDRRIDWLSSRERIWQVISAACALIIGALACYGGH